MGYPVVVHAIWDNNGFLSAFYDGEGDKFLQVGMVDFAGSGVVHLTGGATALIAAIVLGPRIGRFHDKNGNVLETPASFPAHNVSLQILGTFILWFGWYGFNPGSALVMSEAGHADIAALCLATTTISAAAGCVSCMVADSILQRQATGEMSYDNHPGIFYGGSNLLGAQFVGLIFIVGWVAALMTPFFYALKAAGMFRVDPLEEEVGLDISHHGGG